MTSWARLSLVLHTPVFVSWAAFIRCADLRFLDRQVRAPAEDARPLFPAARSRPRPAVVPRDHHTFDSSFSLKASGALRYSFCHVRGCHARPAIKLP